MQINKINNTNFKQTFMPGYGHYTPEQKELSRDIREKLAGTGYSWSIEDISPNKSTTSRPDLFITSMGTKDSLRVFNCFRQYDYNTYSDNYKNLLYVGKYNKDKPFRVEDIEKARANKVINICKAAIFNMLLFTRAVIKQYKVNKIH